MGTQQFCLRWNNHQTNMLNVFDQLLKTGEFVDVTLACEGLSIKAHKVVLSACSPYFQSLLRENPCKHPIVILKDMRYVELRTIIDFMYKGEINVSQEQLTSLLKTAETLKVKGLAEVSSGIFTNPQGESTTSVIEELNLPTSHQEDARSPQTPHDGRVSPYSKRKRHRPSRRLSSEANVEPHSQPVDTPYNNALDARTTREPVSSVAVTSDSEALTTPKEEPMELLTEPSVELMMESDSHYQPLDLPLIGRSRSTEPREGGFVCNDGGLLATPSQPSTSGSQVVGQGSSTSCITSSPFVPWVRTPCRSGPCKTWQEDTMFSAVRAVLKLGMPLINVSRRFGIPYPTLFYYTNRVRQLLKPYEKEDTTAVSQSRPGSFSTRGLSRPPGKRGRPTKVYLGTWKDEDLTQAILRVVYKDYVPEAMESLVRSVGHIEETTGSWPSGDEGLPDCDIIPVESQIQELEENEEDEEENDEDAVATTHESVGDVKEILRDYRDGKCTAKVEQSETGCHVVQQMGQGHETASVS